MKVTIQADFNLDDDGCVGSAEVVREGLEDHATLARMFVEAANAFGFTYIRDVAFETDDGDILWGDP